MAQTEAQLRANKKYREEKLESITFRVPKGNKARIQAHAAASPIRSEPPHRAIFKPPFSGGFCF